MSEWKECTVDELCIKITDGSHFSPQEVEIGIPMFSVKDMEQNGFSYKSVKKIAYSDFKKLEKSDCKPLKNDVLIAKDGSYLKHVFVCREEREEVILSSIAILRPNIDRINPDYFKYILSSPSVKNMMANYVSGVAIPRIILNDFKKMTLTIPFEIKTQQKIANILGTYDELIEVNNERIKILEETAQSLYKEWFVRFRFPNYQDTEFIKGVPKGWEVVRIDTLYRTSSGATPSREINEYYENANINWVKTGELSDSFVYETKEKISELGLKKSSAKVFPPYTVIFAMYGNTIGQLGIITEPSATNQACCALLPITEDYSYQFIFLTLFFHRNAIISLGMGAAQQNVSQDEIKKYKILKPNKDLVLKFDEIISPIFIQIETLQQQNTELRQIRDRLLPRLISGKLVV